MPQLIQPSFAGGEVSSDIYSRVDIAKYAVALRKCVNYFVRAQGGASTRAGLEFIAPCKFKNKKARLIKFQFSTTQNYMLEFGDQYMRVIKDGGLVLEANKAVTNVTADFGLDNSYIITVNAHGYTNGQWVFLTFLDAGVSQLNGRYFIVSDVTTNTFKIKDVYTGNYEIMGVLEVVGGSSAAARVYEIATPYLEFDLPLLKKTQKFDVMTLTHPSYAPRELTRSGHAAWALNAISFLPSISAPTGVGVVATNATTLYTISGITKANPAVVTTAVAHEFATGNSVYIVAAGMTQVNGKFFSVRVLTTTTFELVGIDSTSYGTFTSGNVRRAKENYKYVVTSIAADTFEESLQSAAVTVINDLSLSNGKNTVTWAAVAGAQKYYIYREVNGSGVYGYVGSSTTTTFVDDNIDPETTDTPPGSRNPFNGADKYPFCVTYHEQRRVFGGTNTTPQTAYATQAGNFKNMNVSSPARDDDAWTFEIGSDESVAIRHLVSLNDLLVLTAGGVFVFAPGSNGDTITPNSISVKPGTRVGSSDVPPLIIEKACLFVESSQPTDAFDLGYAIRDLSYSFQDDGYTGNDLTILAKHLFRQYKLKEWCYCSRPYGIAWGVREDGVVVALTYLREQEVFAWSRHFTEGAFESVDQISENGENTPYFIVNRTIDGEDRRYIERMHSREFVNADEAFCVDSGLTLNNYQTNQGVSLTGGTTWEADDMMTLSASLPNTFSSFDVGRTFKLVTRDDDGLFDEAAYVQCVTYTNGTTLQVKAVQIIPEVFQDAFTVEWARCADSIKGLYHLEGQLVSILADGNVEPQQVVENGTITFQEPTAIAHIGIGYDCDLQTLAIAGDVSKGSLLGKKVNIGRFNIVVQETRGLLVGPNAEKLKPLKQRQYENWNESTRLKTGVIEVLPTGKWADGSMLIRQSDPLPATIQAVIPDVIVGG